jgi:hypothetical protein
VSWAYAKLPRIDFSNVTSLSYAIYSTQLEYIDFYINSAKCTNFSDALSFNRKLKWIVGVDLSSATTIFDLFSGCSALETIQEPLNIPNVTDAKNARTAFLCEKLKDIRFDEECIKVSITFTSKELTVDSAKSILLGLKNFVDDFDNQYAYEIKLPDEVWELLKEEPDVVTSMGKMPWYDYVVGYKCWNT